MEAITPAPVTTTTVQPASSSGMDYAGWVLLGGGLLLVAGGATFAMTRRPRRRDEVSTAFEPTISTSIVPPVAAIPVAAEPARPIAAVETPVASTPAFATRSYADVQGDDHHAALESMIAEAPSEANPFHSRRNRLRRADFLLRTGQVVPSGAIAPARQEQEATARDRWTEMSFGGRRATRLSWKPVTNR